MTYEVRQVSNKFGLTVVKPSFLLDSIVPMELGSTYWANNISNDEESGMYEVLGEIA